MFLTTYPELRNRRLIIFLGRIHPKKGIDLLCRAWAAIAQKRKEAHLIIAGPDTDNSRSSLEASVATLGIRERVTFTGLLTGDAKWSAFRAASLFVLPSYSEGFSVAILEALAIGCPVIITHQCHFPEVSDSGSGWVIEPQVEQLITALDQALGESDNDLAGRGKAGKQLVAARYGWRSIADKMTRAYDMVIS